MRARLQAYGELMRLEKPIGIYLLLWPTLWALWIAGAGSPPREIVLIFVLGVMLMRSAGCVVNDIADRKIDGHVERTKNRPLARGAVSTAEAIGLFLCLTLLAASLLAFLNTKAQLLSIPAVILAASYPFAKRFHSLPQAHLGLAFSFGIPMAFAAIQNQIPAIAWFLLIANVLWVIAYDTEYAMSDREDDLKIGVKSSAILFGAWDKRIIGLLQIGMLAILAGIGRQLGFPALYFITLSMIALLFLYHQILISQRGRADCFRAFLHNHWVGLSLFVGIVLCYLPGIST